MNFIDKIKYNSQGLVPAIVQDYKNNEVLMLAYMNQESIKKTIETKTTWFYSRGRQTLWNKGETSGNIQKVMDMYYDCDGDSILVKVEQVGYACHTGEYSCFFNELLINDKNDDKNSDKIIDLLYKLIEGRAKKPIEGSYTNYLLTEGLDKILKKVGEESSEVIIAAKNNDKKEIVYEVADLVYHTLILLVEKDIKPTDIRQELLKRYSK